MGKAVAQLQWLLVRVQELPQTGTIRRCEFLAILEFSDQHGGEQFDPLFDPLIVSDLPGLPSSQTFLRCCGLRSPLVKIPLKTYLDGEPGSIYLCPHQAELPLNETLIELTIE